MLSSRCAVAPPSITARLTSMQASPAPDVAHRDSSHDSAAGGDACDGVVADSPHAITEDPTARLARSNKLRTLRCATFTMERSVKGEARVSVDAVALHEVRRDLRRYRRVWHPTGPGPTRGVLDHGPRQRAVGRSVQPAAGPRTLRFIERRIASTRSVGSWSGSLIDIVEAAVPGGVRVVVGDARREHLEESETPLRPGVLDGLDGEVEKLVREPGKAPGNERRSRNRQAEIDRVEGPEPS